MASFISATACSMGMTPLRVKKEACRIVLVRFPVPASGDGDGVDGVEPGVLFRQSPLHGGGQILLQTRLVPGAVEEEGAPSFRFFTMSYLWT